MNGDNGCFKFGFWFVSEWNWTPEAQMGHYIQCGEDCLCPSCVAELEAEIEQLRVERNGAMNAGLRLEEMWKRLDVEADRLDEVQDGAGDYLRVVKKDIEDELPVEENEK